MTTDRQLKLPPLGDEFDALEPAYSKDTLELHYTKHHQAYVDGANDAQAAIDAARASGDLTYVRQLGEDLAFNVSGHVLHSLFWSNMSPVIGEERLPDDLARCIQESFGGPDVLRDQFIAAGTSIQGSGWAALCWQPAVQSLVVEQILDHQNNLAIGGTPILVTDMCEHAFYLQYRNDKQRWAKAFWGLVNWGDVDAQLGNARGSHVII